MHLNENFLWFYLPQKNYLPSNIEYVFFVHCHWLVKKTLIYLKKWKLSIFLALIEQVDLIKRTGLGNMTLKEILESRVL